MCKLEIFFGENSPINGRIPFYLDNFYLNIFFYLIPKNTENIEKIKNCISVYLSISPLKLSSLFPGFCGKIDDTKQLVLAVKLVYLYRFRSPFYHHSD